MQVRDVMTPFCEFIAPDASISDAARPPLICIDRIGGNYASHYPR